VLEDAIAGVDSGSEQLPARLCMPLRGRLSLLLAGLLGVAFLEGLVLNLKP
jgi:hypothetical protein